MQSFRKPHFKKTPTKHLPKKENENKQNNKSYGSLLCGDSWEGERRKQAKKTHSMKIEINPKQQEKNY